jgi:hypothetical protein
VTQAGKLDAIAALYEAVYNATESFCEGGDLVGQTLYLFPADSGVWNLVEDTD